MEIDYAGNTRTQPDAVRLRAATGRSLLKRTKLELDGRDLTVGGTTSTRVKGVVRLRVTYITDELVVRVPARSRRGMDDRRQQLSEPGDEPPR